MTRSDPLGALRDLKSQAKDYPGGRPPANRPTYTPDPTEVEWDKDPVTYIHGGQAREFFTIGHLALALNRSVVTIRSWEKKGLLPQSRYRSPQPRGHNPQGGQPKGKRLYTRRQIDGVLAIAKEFGVVQYGEKKQNPPTIEFTRKVSALYNVLAQEEEITK